MTEADFQAELVGRLGRALVKPQPKQQAAEEVGLYRCDFCDFVQEIPRGIAEAGCEKCRKMLIRKHFIHHAHPVSMAWLHAQTNGLPPPERRSYLPVRSQGRSVSTAGGTSESWSLMAWLSGGWHSGAPPPERDELLQSVQADLQTRRENFGDDDDVILITRQSSTLFDVHCCSEDSAPDVTPALLTASTTPPQQPASRTEGGPVCKVCMDQRPDIVLRPCNHGGLCEACVRKMFHESGRRECPWCRQPVSKVLKVEPTASTVARARVLTM